MDSKYMMLGTLLISVFVAGSHFNNSFNERNEMRQKIADLETRHEALLAQVQKDKAEYDEKGQRFRQDIKASNDVVNALANKKTKIEAEQANSHKRAEGHKQEIEFDLSRMNKFIASNPMRLDTVERNIQ